MGEVDVAGFEAVDEGAEVGGRGAVVAAGGLDALEVLFLGGLGVLGGGDWAGWVDEGVIEE